MNFVNPHRDFDRISDLRLNPLSPQHENQAECVEESMFRGVVDLLPPPSTRDFIGRALMTLYFTICATLKAGALAITLAYSQLTVPRAIDVVADFAALGFLVLMVMTTVARLPPVKTAQGIEPRISALIGCFATMTLIAVPRTQTFPQLQLIADLVTIVGFALCIWCLFWLGRSFSITAQARRLVTAGPYSFVRHPLYACEAVVVAGIVLRNPTWVTFVVCAVALTFQYRRLLNEEKVLKAAFPEYDAYRRATPMLLPSLFRSRVQ
jgi:protein-S-isoprenylcysteine O-methyltransferase Ste14